MRSNLDNKIQGLLHKLNLDPSDEQAWITLDSIIKRIDGRIVLRAAVGVVVDIIKLVSEKDLELKYANSLGDIGFKFPSKKIALRLHTSLGHWLIYSVLDFQNLLIRGDRIDVEFDLLRRNPDEELKIPHWKIACSYCGKYIEGNREGPITSHSCCKDCWPLLPLKEKNKKEFLKDYYQDNPDEDLLTTTGFEGTITSFVSGPYCARSWFIAHWDVGCPWCGASYLSQDKNEICKQCGREVFLEAITPRKVGIDNSWTGAGGDYEDPPFKRKNPLDEDLRKAVRRYQKTGSESDKIRMVRIQRLVDPLCQEGGVQPGQSPLNAGRKSRCPFRQYHLSEIPYIQSPGQSDEDANYRANLGFITDFCDICKKYLCESCAHHKIPSADASDKCSGCGILFDEIHPCYSSYEDYCNGTHIEGLCELCFQRLRNDDHPTDPDDLQFTELDFQ